ncbi:hypothetical protein [Streptomyces sp. AM 2-1-1]|uniref:hypothetical protein n=1 Tax=Streptomyces sp. AM 2-1-1 TaxID=3028709 RepID=UPI0023BA0F71|nr:hypothetical protein [Streptomyces sp. AM 2-1-1]WEH38091.1 hypothetical protein PZB77_00380 [Streptomyces sp. AM 2-1-1]
MSLAAVDRLLALPVLAQRFAAAAAAAYGPVTGDRALRVAAAGLGAGAVCRPIRAWWSAGRRASR